MERLGNVEPGEIADDPVRAVADLDQATVEEGADSLDRVERDPVRPVANPRDRVLR